LWQGGAEAVRPAQASAAHAATHWTWANNIAAATATISFAGGIAILRSRGYPRIYKAESCPAFFGMARRLHLGFSEPAAIEGWEEKRLGGLLKVRDELWVYLNSGFDRL
jgi:hypothetical protein